MRRCNPHTYTYESWLDVKLGNELYHYYVTVSGSVPTKLNITTTGCDTVKPLSLPPTRFFFEGPARSSSTPGRKEGKKGRVGNEGSESEGSTCASINSAPIFKLVYYTVKKVY